MFRPFILCSNNSLVTLGNRSPGQFLISTNKLGSLILFPYKPLVTPGYKSFILLWSVKKRIVRYFLFKRFVTHGYSNLQGFVNYKCELLIPFPCNTPVTLDYSSRIDFCSKRFWLFIEYLYMPYFTPGYSSPGAFLIWKRGTQCRSSIFFWDFAYIWSQQLH